MNEFLWEQTDAPATADLAIVDGGLDRANQSAADLAAVRPLACLVRMPSGELIAGAIARTWGGCCELRQLWVATEHRRRGIARRLVEMIEAAAHKRGCAQIYLETFSFQAPQLYRELGYETACEFRGFPNGICKLILSKSLNRDATPQ